MARSDPAHEPPRDRSALRGTLALVLFLALVAAGVATWRYDLLDLRREDPPPAGSAAPPGPATVAPPPGLDLPAVTPPPAVAVETEQARGVDAAAVRSTLAPYLGDRDLGRHVLAEVASLAGGRPAYTVGDRDIAIPASTTKLVTGAAALLALGPDHVFSTQVRADGGNRIVLVGGGDPFLERGPTTTGGERWPYPARADLATLAAQTAAALRADGRSRVRLVFDDALFTGPAVNDAWKADYVPDGEVSPTSALWVDAGRDRQGFDRVADPAAEAAASFAEALSAAGVSVVGPARRAASPSAPGARVLASVDSAPLGSIVERLLEVSDNDASEVLLRHVGVAAGDEGSIDAGRRAVRSVLSAAGVRFGDSVFFDGSGLSRDNRADPSTLVGVLRLAADPERPGLRPLLTGLPVAGFTGSLTARMDRGPAAGLGRVRAKTGTLNRVSSLAGIATDLEGTTMVFVLMVDRVRPVDSLEARTVLDSAAAALGACACSR